MPIILGTVGIITNSYATGTATSGAYARGLIGFLDIVSAAGVVVKMKGRHYFVNGAAIGTNTNIMCAACQQQTVANIRGITSSTAPSAWSTGRTQWDLDYGNSSQRPAIKHVQNPDPPSSTQPRWCSNPGSPNLSGLSACGSIISGQR